MEKIASAIFRKYTSEEAVVDIVDQDGRYALRQVRQYWDEATPCLSGISETDIAAMPVEELQAKVSDCWGEGFVERADRESLRVNAELAKRMDLSPGSLRRRSIYLLLLASFGAVTALIAGLVLLFHPVAASEFLGLLMIWGIGGVALLIISLLGICYIIVNTQVYGKILAENSEVNEQEFRAEVVALARKDPSMSVSRALALVARNRSTSLGSPETS